MSTPTSISLIRHAEKQIGDCPAPGDHDRRHPGSVLVDAARLAAGGCIDQPVRGAGGWRRAAAAHAGPPVRLGDRTPLPEPSPARDAPADRGAAPPADRRTVPPGPARSARPGDPGLRGGCAGCVGAQAHPVDHGPHRRGPVGGPVRLARRPLRRRLGPRARRPRRAAFGCGRSRSSCWPGIAPTPSRARRRRSGSVSIRTRRPDVSPIDRRPGHPSRPTAPRGRRSRSRDGRARSGPTPPRRVRTAAKPSVGNAGSLRFGDLTSDRERGQPPRAPLHRDDPAPL